MLDLGGVLMNGDDVTLHAPAVTLTKYSLLHQGLPSLNLAPRLDCGDLEHD